MANQVTLSYKCRACEARFTQVGNRADLHPNTLTLMQHLGLARHQCPDGRTGIGELVAYEPAAAPEA